MNEIEIVLPQEYTNILAKVKDALPLANIDATNFNKSSSQFKLATLDITDLTPINSAKHLLAVIQKTRQALEQASIDLRRKKLELKRKELDLMAAEGTDIDSLVIDIDVTASSRVKNNEHVEKLLYFVGNAHLNNKKMISVYFARRLSDPEIFKKIDEFFLKSSTTRLKKLILTP